MNDPLIWPYFLGVGGGIGGLGPLDSPWFCWQKVRGLSQLCSGGLGPIYAAEVFRKQKTKKAPKNLRFACVFFWLFWFQCDKKKNGCFGDFFLGGWWFARMGM